MKKLLTVLFAVLSVTTVFALAACTEETDEPHKDYSTYSANRAALHSSFLEKRAVWTEPSDYSFTYKFSRAMQIYQAPITVTVKDGIATFTGADEITLQAWQKFDSISAVYDFFEEHWQAVDAEHNTNLGISFLIEYSKYGDWIYPSTLKEDIEWCGKGDAPIGADSGDILIVITDFTVNE